MTTEPQQHTPTPWQMFPPGSIIGHSKAVVIKRPHDFDWVASVQVVNIPEWEANARFIVQACNSFEELLVACKAVLPAIRWGMAHQPGNLNQWRDCEALICHAIAKAASPQP